jgi:hypothetical protein
MIVAQARNGLRIELPLYHDGDDITSHFCQLTKNNNNILVV